MVLTFASVNEILGYDHSNETSSLALSHGTIYIKVLNKMKIGISVVCSMVIMCQ